MRSPALSVPPLFILPALFVAMPLWVWALDGAERLGGIRRIFGPAFTIGFAFGLGYFTVAFHWLGAAFLTRAGSTSSLMPFAIVALAALIALFWGLASALAHLFWSGGALPHRDARDLPQPRRMGCAAPSSRASRSISSATR